MTSKKLPHPNNNSLLAYASYVIALGGFLFGYDTGVVNGALSFMSQPDQLNLSANNQGWVSGALVLGCTFGALFCGQLADKFGRRWLLHAVATVFTLATLGCFLALNILMLSIFRFILGLSVGCASTLAPMYLNEISPDRYKSRNVNKNAVAVVVGQLSAFIMNALLGSLFPKWHAVWRLMILLAGIPAVILWILSINLPQSPTWQVIHSTREKARATFHRLGFPRLDIKEVIDQVQEQKKPQTAFSLTEIWHHKALLYLLLAGTAIGLIQQFSGVNVVMYYGTTLLEKVGMGASASLYGNVLIGIVSSIATTVGSQLTLNHSHQHLLLVGLTGNVVCLSILTIIMQTHFLSQNWLNLLVLFFLTSFLALQQGLVSPVTWLLLSEIFPPVVKSNFMSWSTTVIWLSNFIISLIFPALVHAVGIGNVFLIFAGSNIGCICLTLIFVNRQYITAINQQFNHQI